MATRVAVPIVNIGSTREVTLELAALSPQKLWAPIRFDGVIEDLAFAMVRAQFYERSTHLKGQARVIGNEMQCSSQPTKDGTGISYTLTGNTPAKAGPYHVEISVSYVDPNAKHSDDTPPTWISSVIATGEIEVH